MRGKIIAHTISDILNLPVNTIVFKHKTVLLSSTISKKKKTPYLVNTPFQRVRKYAPFHAMSNNTGDTLEGCWTTTLCTTFQAISYSYSQVCAFRQPSVILTTGFQQGLYLEPKIAAAKY